MNVLRIEKRTGTFVTEDCATEGDLPIRTRGQNVRQLYKMKKSKHWSTVKRESEAWQRVY